MSSGSYAFAGVPQTYYRITSASVGPKGTVAVVQTMAIIPQ
jgi:Tfp pilus assembly protein PilX